MEFLAIREAPSLSLVMSGIWNKGCAAMAGGFLEAIRSNMRCEGAEEREPI